MAKLKLMADPTFKAKVGIPVAGGEPVEVEFTFQFRTTVEFDALINKHVDTTNLDYIMDIAQGWENDEPFTRENVEIFLSNYWAAAREIAIAYARELNQAKVGNLLERVERSIVEAPQPKS
jgi:hypothetical protein